MNKSLVLVAVGVAASVAQAGPVLVYENDFASVRQVGPEWVTSPVWNSAQNFGGFIGRFGQETHILELGAYRPDKDGDGGGPGDDGDDGGDGGGGGDHPGGGGSGGGGQGGGRSAVNYTLAFDLYLLDSWDGGYEGSYGPDYFGVSVNGQSLLWEGWHSTRVDRNIVLPDVGPVNLGFNPNYADSIYRDLTLSFWLAPDVETLRISFIGDPSSWSVDDESWAIDNVRLTAVPGPSSLALSVVTLGLAGRRRRRA